MLYTTLGPQYHQPKGHILELLFVLKNDLAFNISGSSPGSICSNLLRIWAFRHGDLGLPKELSTPNALYWLYPKGSTFMDNMTFSQKPNQSQTLLRGKRRGCVSLPSSPPVAKHEPPTKNILCGGKSLELKQLLQSTFDCILPNQSWPVSKLVEASIQINSHHLKHTN